MNWRARQNFFYKALRQLAGRLVVFLDNRDHQTWLNIFADRTVHSMVQKDDTPTL